ncbi:MAG: acetyl-CoA carboxylase biotin carboxyl carrier protein [Oscillospiraceae bacterium]|nr:acetyl-CoA carboxylase biotin carboxyl carrier protein [Oscillospiraceae bacterium]
MYSLDQIKQLIEILEDSQLAVMELTDEKGGSIRLEKPAAAPVNTFAVNTGNAPAAPAAVPQPLQEASAPQIASEQPEQTAANTIKAPMVGVFYAAASPESSPFVTVGQKVNKGDVVCIIEAMKLMNEITADQSGTIAEIYVNNGDIVEYGQPLFKIS